MLYRDDINIRCGLPRKKLRAFETNDMWGCEYTCENDHSSHSSMIMTPKGNNTIWHGVCGLIPVDMVEPPRKRDRRKRAKIIDLKRQAKGE